MDEYFANFQLVHNVVFLWLTYAVPYTVIITKYNSRHFVKWKFLEFVQFVFTVTWCCLLVSIIVNYYVNTSIESINDYIGLSAFYSNNFIKIGILISLLLYHKEFVIVIEKISKLDIGNRKISTRIECIGLMILTHATAAYDLYNLFSPKIAFSNFVNWLGYLNKYYAHTYTVLYLDFVLNTMMNYLKYQLTCNMPFADDKHAINFLKSTTKCKRLLFRSWDVIQPLVFMLIWSDVVELVLTVAYITTDQELWPNAPYILLSLVRIILIMQIPTRFSKFVSIGS